MREKSKSTTLKKGAFPPLFIVVSSDSVVGVYSRLQLALDCRDRYPMCEVFYVTKGTLIRFYKSIYE